MCGVVGIVSKNEVASDLYEALTVIQHRGQDAAGIATSEEKRLNSRKQLGLVREVFREHHIQSLTGKIGIAHVRYPTAGGASRELAQPMYVNSPYGISIVHNGNLVNTDSLCEELAETDRRHLNTNSDSEVILNIFAHELQQIGGVQPSKEEIFEAVTRMQSRLSGAYSIIIMINNVGLVAVRDPHGIRPLIIGKRDEDLMGAEYMIASESAAIDALDFKIIDDIAAGETIFISKEGKMSRSKSQKASKHSPCIFEYVYLARPDSVIDKVSVHKARQRMGTYLGEKILGLYPEHEIDVVIPIPESSTTSANEVAKKLGLPYREGFVKNRYIGRTFIMPKQEMRRKSVKRKLNPITMEFEGKNVLLVDDSIVRGTTSKQIVEMAREAGAKKVFFASAAPPIRFQNVYGIDMAATTELIAHQKDEDQIAEYIGADWLVYQNLEDLIRSAKEGNKEIENFETSIFDGEYLDDQVSSDYLKNLEVLRSDSNKI
ncbi:MAG: amidophosphoribosyltransferase [Pseudomonadota bacterium]|jgi:amidophosphoribosyltransferase|nr:amidophosphoribosyltransferase [Pseudomonadota bacterium]MEC9226735.1 amidophosphoribosyltransferase [Pseudomonadota bacterium]